MNRIGPACFGSWYPYVAGRRVIDPRLFMEIGSLFTARHRRSGRSDCIPALANLGIGFMPGRNVYSFVVQRVNAAAGR
jgi:hypothetical protein